MIYDPKVETDLDPMTVVKNWKVLNVATMEKLDYKSDKELVFELNA